MILELYKELSILLYFEFVIIIFITNLNIKIYNLNNDFVIYYRSDLNYIVL